MPLIFRLLKWILRFIMLLGKETVFKLDYYQGYNFNFKITKEEAESLLPKNLKPLKLKLLKSDPKPDYYLSWYLASVDSSAKARAMERIDLFTYAIDDNDEYCLFFVASIMELPDFVAKNKVNKKMFTRLFDFFARDSHTYKSAYPHYYTNKVRARDDSFVCEYGDSAIEAVQWKTKSKNEQFDPIFVLANSQIYRTDIDKNVNFFNQRFICAPVRHIDLSSIKSKNLEGFYPLCKKLVSAHFYGSREKPSRWYFEV